MEGYLSVDNVAEGYLEEKKSRFIAHIKQVSSEEEALQYIAQLRKQYWDAKHNCYAYIIGSGSQPLERSSDDGEPSKTAGIPMLEVLRGAGLKNVVCVVTRYFGGVLLGTGGLVRAYQGAVKDAVTNAAIVSAQELVKLVITSPYDCYNSVEYLVQTQGIKTDGSVFTDKVQTTVYVPEEETGQLENRLNDISGGRCVVQKQGIEWVFVPATQS